MEHPTFLQGRCTTRFIDLTPDLFKLPRRRDRATRLLRFLSDVIVNGNPIVKGLPRAERREPAQVPTFDSEVAAPDGIRQRLLSLGPQKFSQWILQQKPLLLTDTTFRDAHQSLLATRFRTIDLVNVAEAYAHGCPEMFSLEMWGGATFDTSMRFLKESPWDRLAQMREKVPNISAADAAAGVQCGRLHELSRQCGTGIRAGGGQAGIDVFRVFDALNWIPNMRVAVDAVLSTNAICEAAICYTGDILDPHGQNTT